MQRLPGKPARTGGVLRAVRLRHLPQRDLRRGHVSRRRWDERGAAPGTRRPGEWMVPGDGKEDHRIRSGSRCRRADDKDKIATYPTENILGVGASKKAAGKHRGRTHGRTSDFMWQDLARVGYAVHGVARSKDVSIVRPFEYTWPGQFHTRSNSIIGQNLAPKPRRWRLSPQVSKS